MYPLHRDTEASPSPNLPQIERETLEWWQAGSTFARSIQNRPPGENGSNEFVFYDGPPFANGLPHYGHLLTGYVKDVVPRYETMRGRRVERRFGWDCHGLPAEVEAEHQLGITHKSEIEDMGVARFNEVCRTSVLRYTDEWEAYVTRQARWVDFTHDYKTLDLDYMESVMWAFKTLWDKGLVYEGYRVLWYCWRCETPLSNSETRMDDTYRPRQDTAVTVAFTLGSRPADGAAPPPADGAASPVEGASPDSDAASPVDGEVPAPGDVAPSDVDLAGVKALAWTTTPWTLPSNLALAVHPEVTYVVVETDALPGERLLLAEARLDAYARELGEVRVVARLQGADLVDTPYAPLFDFFAGRPGAHRVLAADYVTTEDGTGLVHIAPAFGEDDKVVTDAAGIEVVNPVDAHGNFTSEVPPWAGLNIFEANRPITRALREAGVLLRAESYEHPYPHCWRCDTPLIQRAVSSWFVAVTKFRDRMVELNQEIRWEPEHVKDGQFGKWLEGARDWSISRNRYWGSPIPVWCSDDPAYPRTDVYGSLDELERDFGVRPTDLHRPFVDDLVRPNPDDPTGHSMMRRVPEVLDCWFDSGSMPYAQVHYPFENREWFEHHYPGDFIVEYIGQTRGWFYNMHVLATALFDRPAFRTCVAHGIVLGSDGRKMSKSLRNYPDVNEVFDTYGSDAMRWYLMASPILRGGNLVVTEEGIRDGVRQVLLPLWNAYYFFCLYADACDGGKGYTARRVTAADHGTGSASSGVASTDDGGAEATSSADDGAAGGRLSRMDRYMLAQTRVLVAELTAQMDDFDIAGACESVRTFLDTLNNWYIRNSRDRFWDEDPAAFDTLFTVLEILTRVMAPLAPLLAEELHRGLTGGESVHLTDWPDLGAGTDDDGALRADADLVASMNRAREVCSATLGLRKANQLRVRQPLRRAMLAVPDPAAMAPFTELIGQEINVKEVSAVGLDASDAQAYGVYRRLDVAARAAGPRLGRTVQAVIRSAKAGAWHEQDGTVVVDTPDGTVALVDGEYTVSTVVADREGDELAAAVLPSGGFVVLDLALDDALLGEGYARDVVRVVQDERKAAGLHVADRIHLSLAVPAEWQLAVDEHRDMISAETLAVDLRIEDSPAEILAAHVEKA